MRTSEFTPGYLEPLGIVSMLDAPIFYHGQVIGVVCHEQVGQQDGHGRHRIRSFRLLSAKRYRCLWKWKGAGISRSSWSTRPITTN